MCLKCVWRSAGSNISRPFCVYNCQLKIYVIMNSKIANLLSENINNKKIITEMIMYICNKAYNIEDHLIDLCLGTDTNFVTKDMILKHIDKIQPLCMAYMENIESVSCINVLQIDNIDCTALIEFKAEVTAWFKDQESADKKDSWYANKEENEDFKVKGTYITMYTMYIPFKDIDIKVD